MKGLCDSSTDNEQTWYDRRLVWAGLHRAGHIKYFGLYPMSKGKPLRCFKPGGNGKHDQICMQETGGEPGGTVQD